MAGRSSSPTTDRRVHPEPGTRSPGYRVPQNSTRTEESAAADRDMEDPLLRTGEEIICPVCGAVAVREKCKVVCRSNQCRGRVVMNCSEF
jgi:hypothetical protein